MVPYTRNITSSATSFCPKVIDHQQEPITLPSPMLNMAVIIDISSK